MDNEFGSTSEDNRDTSTDSPSESSNTVSTDDTTSDSVDQSREDVNTPAEGKDEANSEDQKPVGQKGLNRFQQLANDKRELSQREKEELARRNPQQQGVYPMPGATPPVPQYNPLIAQQVYMQRELEIIKEEREFDEASRKFPELDRNAETYDPKFHDLVWGIRKAEPGVTYAEAAGRVKDILAQRESKIREKVETRIEEKSANSVQGGQSRTKVSGSEHTNAVKAAWQKFQSTGLVEDLARYNSLKAQGGNK